MIISYPSKYTSVNKRNKGVLDDYSPARPCSMNPGNLRGEKVTLPTGTACRHKSLNPYSRVQKTTWTRLSALNESERLTLPCIECRGFFLHPARLLVARVGVRVEAVCPEAFAGEPEVSLCPKVPSKAFARMFNAAL